MATDTVTRDPWLRSTGELKTRVTRAASVYALERTDLNRAVLARAMRRALGGGIGLDEVAALAVLPREEARQLIGG